MATWTNSPLKIYHGTTIEDAQNVVLKIDPAKFALRKDFGPGFYTTTWLEQANRWANQRVQDVFVARRVKVRAAVVEFTLDRDDLAKLDTLWFVKATSDFWDLTQSCRSFKVKHPWHARKSSTPYDVVVGPVVMWSQPYAVIPNYDQAAFFTEAALGLLQRSARIL